MNHITPKSVHAISYRTPRILAFASHTPDISLHVEVLVPENNRAQWHCYPQVHRKNELIVYTYVCLRCRTSLLSLGLEQNTVFKVLAYSVSCLVVYRSVQAVSAGSVWACAVEY